MSKWAGVIWVTFRAGSCTLQQWAWFPGPIPFLLLEHSECWSSQLGSWIWKLCIAHNSVTPPALDPLPPGWFMTEKYTFRHLSHLQFEALYHGSLVYTLTKRINFLWVGDGVPFGEQYSLCISVTILKAREDIRAD